MLIVKDHDLLNGLVGGVFLGRFEFVAETVKDALDALDGGRLGNDRVNAADLEVAIESLAVGDQLLQGVRFLVAVEKQGGDHHVKHHGAC